jgi:hypothetical protein
MSLQQIKKQLERMKELARERPAYCACRFIEIVKGAPLSEEQERVLESNRECYTRNHEQRAHVGFSRIELPAA